MQVMMSDPRYLWKGHSIFIILVSRINIFFIYNIIKNENHTLEDSDKMPYIYSNSNLSNIHFFKNFSLENFTFMYHVIWNTFYSIEKAFFCTCPNRFNDQNIENVLSNKT